MPRVWYDSIYKSRKSTDPFHFELMFLHQVSYGLKLLKHLTQQVVIFLPTRKQSSSNQPFTRWILPVQGLIDLVISQKHPLICYWCPSSTPNLPDKGHVKGPVYRNPSLAEIWLAKTLPTKGCFQINLGYTGYILVQYLLTGWIPAITTWRSCNPLTMRWSLATGPLKKWMVGRWSGLPFWVAVNFWIAQRLKRGESVIPEFPASTQEKRQSLLSSPHEGHYSNDWGGPHLAKWPTRGDVELTVFYAPTKSQMMLDDIRDVNPNKNVGGTEFSARKTSRKIDPKKLEVQSVGIFIQLKGRQAGHLGCMLALGMIQKQSSFSVCF